MDDGWYVFIPGPSHLMEAIWESRGWVTSEREGDEWD